MTSSTEAKTAQSKASDETLPPGVTVRTIIQELHLGFRFVLLAGAKGVERTVRNARVQKSGLALVGHFHGVEPWRPQILGATELSYLDTLSGVSRHKACLDFAGLMPCCMIVTRGATPHEELLSVCEQTDTPLLQAPLKSSSTINALHAYLDEKLAPRTQIHGVLVRIFGVGVLILGRSGIGKSECALDLVMRGHRLVADDVVECAYRPPGLITGEPAALLAHHIEIRGLGILNVKDLFGVTSICERMSIDLVAQLSDSQDVLQGVGVDRLGLERRTLDILGVAIPEVTIPVRPGRDMATILEIAARNELLKRAGHDASRAFAERLERSLLGTSTLSASSLVHKEKQP